MIPEIRAAYNRAFTNSAYESFTAACSERFGKEIEFKICETPVFIPKEFGKELIKAGDDILRVICNPDFKQVSGNAIPPHLFVPGDEGKPVFIALDFGICDDGNGKLIPQLIEMQGFASLYCWQNELAINYRKYFQIPDDLTHLFSHSTGSEYQRTFKNLILGSYEPRHVILLEIEPEKQKTWIDFYLTHETTGIEPVCITDIIKEGMNLFYMKDGVKTQIHRIYNRLIFDELNLRSDLKYEWDLIQDANVEWVCHPNWFFRISKYTLPFLKNKYVPETLFLNEIKELPVDLENWVLKPLYSFAGHGVLFNVTPQDIEKALPHGNNYILQKKVKYIPVIETPDDLAKCEIRLMYTWDANKDMPTLVINLVRLSKGVMIGVDYNKNKTWVGGTVGFFERDH